MKRAFELMDESLGPQHWWPGETAFEIAVGAILTQNTAWTNVERAIQNLKSAGLLSPHTMRRVRLRRLAALIRPSGYFNQKAARLKTFLSFLALHGSLQALFQKSTRELRGALLGLNGVGPETADSILLYAAGRPVFVVDAYTKRILSRHGWIEEGASYQEVQNLFHACMPPNATIFNQYHALLVNVGKNFCRRRESRCESCPLQTLLPKESLGPRKGTESERQRPGRLGRPS